MAPSGKGNSLAIPTPAQDAICMPVSTDLSDEQQSPAAYTPVTVVALNGGLILIPVFGTHSQPSWSGSVLSTGISGWCTMNAKVSTGPSSNSTPISCLSFCSWKIRFSLRLSTSMPSRVFSDKPAASVALPLVYILTTSTNFFASLAKMEAYVTSPSGPWARTAAAADPRFSYPKQNMQW